MSTRIRTRTRTRSGRVQLAAALTAGLWVGAGFAQGTAAPPAQQPELPAIAPSEPTQRPLWELGIGAGALHLPNYRGSDQSHNWLLPVPYVVYRGEIFKADRDGARAVLFASDRLDVDLSAGASAPSRSDDDDARRGMHDLKPTFELGPNVNTTLASGGRWKVDLRLPVRAAVTVEAKPQLIGWVSTPNVNLDVADLRGWNLGIKLGPVLQTRRFNGYFYDVPADQATATRPAYRASGGYAGSQALMALSRRFHIDALSANSFWTGAFLKYDTLAGARFEDSPLVKQRSQWSFGVALTWVFATSAEMVSVRD